MPLMPSSVWLFSVAQNLGSVRNSVRVQENNISQDYCVVDTGNIESCSCRHDVAVNYRAHHLAMNEKFCVMTWLASLRGQFFVSKARPGAREG